MTTVIGFYADQGTPQAYGTEKLFSTRPGKLAYLTAHNKSGTTVYIQLFDSAAAGAQTAEPRVLPCLANQVVAWAQVKMKTGIYVRAVTAADGDETDLIGGNEVKFDAGYLEGL